MKMTRVILLIMTAFLMYLLVTGCSDKTNTKGISPVDSNLEEQSTLQTDTKESYIYAAKIENSATRRTLLDDSKIDIDQDEQQETVELYTAAKKDSKGQIGWDDGQPWLLRVTDDDKEYILFDDYVQLGKLNYWLYTTVENEVHITTMQTSCAGFLITDYKFDSEKKRFERNIVFNPKSNVLVDYSRY